ncbi:MAG: tRNA uridine(34) 5-carboxymethylaminomethyl modification radical SAM/GNAT enzyme Elp3 [Anaerolineales bacterium]|nr:tRNA uridine(34) 5-carboxymethylaminomethyl modification radical SAM/GNAT enzyme Elp3 [Anaerolineales bacterium]
MNQQTNFFSKQEAWQEARQYSSDDLKLARLVLDEVRAGEDVMKAIRRHPLQAGGYLGKHVLVAAYHDTISLGEHLPEPALLERICMKPVRTLSGVSTVTVLTKPYPCPGKCIFCPTDVRMPKSYLPDEPGAMRGLALNFNPYDQVFSRLDALEAVGHPTEKIELLILGGTWSTYKRDYQEWFVKRCFEAMNRPEEITSGDLKEIQHQNENASHRNVGLVIETRPDEITADELRWLRYLGVTKVQMGIQSLDDQILDLNKRGHTVKQALEATALLRAAGFKVVLHWMPNLMGASPETDREDFQRLWSGFCPDEIKIYPTQLLTNTDLYEYWQGGKYTPFTTEELVALIADIKTSIPRYCRVNRVIRDIPSNNVVEGNRRTSLRQDIQAEMKERGTRCQCIRCREVRKNYVVPHQLEMHDFIYPAAFTEEHFISFDTFDDKLAGFVRLSLPKDGAPETDIPDLQDAALIREVHVYGQSLPVGAERDGVAQHSGLGSRLLEIAETTAREHGYKHIAVISAVGTRQYYLDREFERGEFYLVKHL